MNTVDELYESFIEIKSTLFFIARVLFVLRNMHNIKLC